MSRKNRNKTIKEEELSTVEVEKDRGEMKEWKSGLKIFKKAQIRIPQIISDVMAQMSDYTDDEYGILCKADSSLELTGEYIVPKQVVSRVSIDFEADLAECDKGWNVVIHRHPDGCNNFSQCDWDYINTTYDISLLWTVKEGFVNGVARTKIGSQYIWTDIEIIQTYPYIEGLEDAFDAFVSKKSYKVEYKKTEQTAIGFKPKEIANTYTKERSDPFWVHKKAMVYDFGKGELSPATKDEITDSYGSYGYADSYEHYNGYPPESEEAQWDAMIDARVKEYKDGKEVEPAKIHELTDGEWNKFVGKV